MNKDRIADVTFIIIAVAGALILGLSMRHGPGIGGDATIYIFSARDLVDGHGLGLVGPLGEFRLIPYFPPMYSLLLALIGLFGLDMVWGAWWLNLLLFGGMLWLIGAVTYSASRSLVISAGATLVMMVSPVLIPVYSWAMSEPLAIFLGVAGMALLLTYMKDTKRKWLLFASAIASGLSFLTRYSAVAFLITGFISIVLLVRLPMRLRLARAGVYLGIGSIPMLVWLPVDLAHTSTVASRSLETIGGMAARLAGFFPQLRDVVLFWLVPDSWISSPPYPAVMNSLIAVILSLGLAVFAITAIYRSAHASREKDRTHVQLFRLSVMLAVFSFVYLLITALVYITTFPPITIASRMLSPLHVTVLWLAAVLAGLGMQRHAGKLIKPGLLLAFALMIGWYGWRCARIVLQNYETGLGYLSPAWQQSETMREVRGLPQDELIVTNDQTAVLFLADRPSYPLTEIYLDQPQEAFTRYGEGKLEGDDGQTAFREDGAALVLFDSLTDQFDVLYHERARKRAASLVTGLREVFQGNDGAIYYYPAQ